ncbi:MAG: enoyl-CoA hydratase/isomerase family protein [Gracilibacteraceae bacterium]|nr:enoyl-CoA hydratase/isomerase family protein [Gracilibacteraceae bacterium]
MEQILLKEEAGGVLKITLNRPEQYNALSNDLMEQLHDALVAFGQDDSRRAAVITGAGANFCSGADIKQFGDSETQTPEMIAWRAQTAMETHGLIAQLSKPVISSVRGYALAGGCGIALAADMVIASENALFGYPECKRGFVPALVLVNLTKLIGRHRALELLLTGRKIGAAEALAWGLINEVVPDGQLEERTMDLARRLAALAPSAAASTKALLYRVEEMPLLEGLRIAKEVNEAMRQTGDFAAGAQGFLQGAKV